jgi:hypothetical protein
MGTSRTEPNPLGPELTVSTAGRTYSRPHYLYLTPNLDEAIWDAELAVGEGPGRVYLVEPIGQVADASELTGRKSPGHPSMSCCSREPLRVTGVVTVLGNLIRQPLLLLLGLSRPELYDDMWHCYLFFTSSVAFVKPHFSTSPLGQLDGKETSVICLHRLRNLSCNSTSSASGLWRLSF